MKHIQEAVRAYLEEAAGIRAVADRTRVRGEYPLLAIGVQEKDSLLLSGGKLAEHTYQVTVTAAGDRERNGSTALLSGLTAPLLRGIPMEQDGEMRMLHPLHITAEGDTLSFSLEVCVPVPPLSHSAPEATDTMETLHLGV